MKNPEFCQAILEQLHHSRAKAIPGNILAKRLGLRNTRQMRLAIQELIEIGYPIIGASQKPQGYYIAETAEECRQGLDEIMSYLKMLGRHHKYLLRASRKLLKPTQMVMTLR